ncbi:MAG: hypothetical protein J0J04_07565 [Microbacterium sp.]|uniref:hypothetical protein n=1 Tax=Microbacterium sp. TaxID=51671 RepID=UPI001AC9F835|nr:hypothetical protein [Microbacterium sp.]MBN9214655.1 hypothetical protein [Microbacterium sp.]
MSTFDETLHPRGQAGNPGQFKAKENDAPAADLENPRADLDAANQAYWDNGDRLIEEVSDYFLHGMPHGAHRVEFEESDQGDYVYVARAFTEDGAPIDTEEDFDRWADVDEIVQLLGHPDDNRTTFRDLFESEDGRVFTWTRTEPTDDATEEAIRGRIDRLAEERRGLKVDSQTGAITAVRNLIPDGATVTFGWSDQGDFLCVEKVTLADGTEIENDWDSDSDIAFDDLDMAASDIRDAGDEQLTEVPGSRGNRYTLTKVATGTACPTDAAGRVDADGFCTSHGNDCADFALAQRN